MHFLALLADPLPGPDSWPLVVRVLLYVLALVGALLWAFAKWAVPAKVDTTIATSQPVADIKQRLGAVEEQVRVHDGVHLEIARMSERLGAIARNTKSTARDIRQLREEVSRQGNDIAETRGQVRTILDRRGGTDRREAAAG